MTDIEKPKQSFREDLNKKFRITVLNQETFEEILANSYTKLNLYLILLAGIIGVGLFFSILIFFTPLRKLVPGYGDIEQHEEVFALKNQIDEMESEIDAQQTYINAFRKMIVGDVSEEDSINADLVNFSENQVNVERSKEDEQLRKEIERAAAEDSKSENSAAWKNDVSLDKLDFFPPITGQVSAEFDLSKKHFGVDVVAPKNTPIKSAMDGVVVGSDWTLENGKTIIVQHDGNIVTVYKHNSALLKEIGDVVQSGEVLAIIGNTGILTSGPHLHFELWYNGKPVDATTYVDF